LIGRDRRARRFAGDCVILRFAQNDNALAKIRDCNRIAALLRERVLRLAFDCKIPHDADFTLR
jgi:hypothetical protein